MSAGARRALVVAAVIGCLGLAALLRPFPDQFVFRYGGDCKRYLEWSRVVRDQGLAAFPKLVDEYRHRWVGFPPPTRWSWLMAIAGVMKLWPNAADEYHPLVLLSWLGGILSLLPLALWLRRRAPPTVMVMALLLVATAPVLRAMSHFPLPDSLHLLPALFVFALTTEALDTRASHASRRWWLLPLLALATAATITTRETGAIVVVAATVQVLWDRRRTGRTAVGPLVAMYGACVAVLIVTIPLAGGARQLVGIAYDVFHGAVNTGNGGFVGGPFYRYLVDFTCASPLLVVTVCASLPSLWKHATLRAAIEPVVVSQAVVLVLFAAFPAYTLRYVMTVDVGMRVIAAAAVWMLWTQGGRRRWWAVALLLGLVALDEMVYVRVWGKDQYYDALTWSFVKGLKMIP